MPLTQEQFQKARSAGFSTEQIIGFEKKREPVNREAIVNRPEYQGGASSPALKQAKTIQKAEEFNVDAQNLTSAPITIPASIATALQSGRDPLKEVQQNFQKGTFPSYSDVLKGAGAKGLGADIGGAAMDVALYPGGARGAVDLAKGVGSLAKMGIEGVKNVGSKIGKLKAPFDESKIIQGNINNLKSEVGLPKESTTGYINKTIINKEKEIRDLRKQQVDSVKNYVNSKIEDIKLDKSEFDKGLLKNPKLIDFSKYMKESSVDWAKKGSKKYGESIDEISSLIPEDAPITASDSANFFKDIAINAENQGINSPMLNYIKQLAGKYDDLAVKQVEANVGDIPINFGTLKSEISGINKYLSPGFKSGKYIEGGDRLASMTKGKWLDFMGKYMPEDGVEAYSKLQNNYKKFADAKRTIGNMFHPYSGEFDLKAGIESGEKIALDNIDEGTQNLMNVLDKGIPEFIPGMKGFSEKAQGLKTVGQERKILDIFPGLIQKSGKLATNKIETKVAEQMRQTSAWRKKYDELVELQKRNQEAKDKIMNVLSMGVRPIVKGIKKGVGL